MPSKQGMPWGVCFLLRVVSSERRIQDAHLEELELKGFEIMSFTDQASQEEVAPDPDMEAEEDLCYLFDRSCLLQEKRTGYTSAKGLRWYVAQILMLVCHRKLLIYFGSHVKTYHQNVLRDDSVKQAMLRTLETREDCQEC